MTGRAHTDHHPAPHLSPVQPPSGGFFVPAASAVGRLSVPIFGIEGELGIDLAHHLGRALQLTNILRDIDEDASLGRLYLPKGSWFDFWTEEKVEGGRDIDRNVDLSIMPLHVRAGSIIPTGPVKQYVDEPVDAPLSVTIYPGANGAFSLRFPEAQWAVTPGQSAVLYDGDVCLGGGVIAAAF